MLTQWWCVHNWAIIGHTQFHFHFYFIVGHIFRMNSTTIIYLNVVAHGTKLVHNKQTKCKFFVHPPLNRYCRWGGLLLSQHKWGQIWLVKKQLWRYESLINKHNFIHKFWVTTKWVTNLTSLVKKTSMKIQTIKTIKVWSSHLNHQWILVTTEMASLVKKIKCED